MWSWGEEEGYMHEAGLSAVVRLSESCVKLNACFDVVN